MQKHEIDTLRQWLALPESITDAEISKGYCDTLIHERVKLTIAAAKLKAATRAALPKWLRWLV